MVLLGLQGVSNKTKVFFVINNQVHFINLHCKTTLLTNDIQKGVLHVWRENFIKWQLSTQKGHF